MPNVEKAFQDFAASLKPPGEQLKASIEKSKQVGEWFKRELKVTGTFPGGAYRRGTGMPMDSIRLHLVMSSKYFYNCRENSVKLLNYLKGILPEDFGDFTTGEGGQVVRIQAPSMVALDLVPSIKLTKEGYLAPNGQGGWYKTNPNREDALFKKKDESSSGKFTGLAKIMKAWNLYTGGPFDPYFIELLVYYRVNDFVKLYAELAHSLFASMRIFLPEFLSCPAAAEVISCGSSPEARQGAMEKAYLLSDKAVSERNAGNAVLIWKSLLGERFG